jgi:peptidoglycan/xylan/chitin deacetylase (PgdA/CDA1 family)
VCVTSYGTDPNVSGDANWQFASQPLTKTADYRATFSYKTTNLSAVHVVAHYVKADGSEDFFGMPDPEPASGNGANWTTYSDTFNVPSDVVASDVMVVMRGLGCLSVDNMQLAPYTYAGFDKGRVILTFDDAPDINFKNALPVLDQYGFKTTLYLPTKEGTWAPGWVEGNTTMEDIVKKFAAGGHEIGAHTITHPDMTTLGCPSPQLTNELKHPQDYLRALTGQPITDFASPYGAYNQCVNGVIAQYYGSHRTTDEGYNSRDNFSAYRLRDQNMVPTTSLALFKYWVDKAARDHTTLILTYHNIDDPNNPNEAPDDYDTYLPDFKAQMSYLKSKGIAVQRLDQALVEMRTQL